MSASNGRVTWEQAVAELLADPERAALARDCYYDGTELEAGQRYWGDAEWQAVRKLMPPAAGQALDIGAGRGIVSYALARDGWRVSALEPDPSTLVGAGAIRKLAEATGYPIEVCEGHGERLPFVDGRFDLVVARQVLHHASDLRSLLREVHRVLKPGGRLIAMRDHVISREADLGAFHTVHPLHQRYGGEHAAVLSEYTSAIESSGLTLTRVIAPLESPINYAPLTNEQLMDGIAQRLPRVLGFNRVARSLLRSSAVAACAVKLLARMDHRPGRLYSFVADRPGA